MRYFLIIHFFPLIISIGHHQATAFFKRIFKSSFFSHRFGPGIDHPVADCRVLCPEWHETPAQHRRAFPSVVGDDRGFFMETYRQERFAEAVEAYDEAVARLERQGEVEARHWSLFYFRGFALESSDQWPRAEADFQQALAPIVMARKTIILRREPRLSLR